MNLEKIGNAYNLFDKATDLLKEDLATSYMDALVETGDNLLEDGKIMIEDGKPTEKVINKIKPIYNDFLNINLLPEEMRQVIQFALVKASKVDKIQPNHQMTPDSIGLLVAYLLEKILDQKEETKILDIAVGTGNLLSTVTNHLKKGKLKDIRLFGVDNDDTMLSVAGMNLKMQYIDADLYYQDAIDNLVTPKVDVVLSDLPIGYYPIDERVVNFETRALKGHSFVHHLLIEQSMLQLLPGGWGVFLVPKNLFESPEAKSLLEVIQKQAHFQGILNLPNDLFTSQESAKSLLLLQKRGNNAKQAKPVLLGGFPAISNKEAFARFLQQVENWINENK
ncbi:class I SAM-dependent methyltransferase [Liquorilactobacillus hordei]|uniref:Adenine-specific DNA methylase n=1 Tax=Liquorilactobacillus hordei DSM 19519 TaxID=1423759 RepID=A0A0R1MBV0_9LACO|nr:class I SAM-dependent methyltransferase [Liquorilactobacillus hordei]KRL05582.1 adenine-specific DNA methylase [Liquorilactobacillus hordei DSM 19519]QYH52793.1 class I SAM-dependent methyltransferase [Liquorilactobacillus hordei DSM 19519]